MADRLVHNISNITRPPSGPRKVVFGGVTIWPGRCAMVPEDAITDKHQALVGTYIFLGVLPPELRARAAVAEGVGPMTAADFEEYLTRLPLADLLVMATKVSPPLRPRPSKETMVRALVRAYRSPESLDPESFFFSRQWTREGLDTYVPVE